MASRAIGPSSRPTSRLSNAGTLVAVASIIAFGWVLAAPGAAQETATVAIGGSTDPSVVKGPSAPCSDAILIRVMDGVVTFTEARAAGKGNGQSLSSHWKRSPGSAGTKIESGAARAVSQERPCGCRNPRTAASPPRGSWVGQAAPLHARCDEAPRTEPTDVPLAAGPERRRPTATS